MPRVDGGGELPGKIAIYVYADHAPPHFHVRSPNGNAVIDLGTLKMVRGTFARKDFAAVVEWAVQNRERLWRAWRLMNERD